MGIIELFILITASLASLFIGISVYSRKPKSVTHILYGLLSLTLVFWSILNYISLRTSSDSISLYVVRGVFITVILQNAFFFLFSSVYPATRKPKFSLLKFLYSLATLLVVALVLLGYVITDFKNGNIVVSPLIAVFILHALTSVIGGFTNLTKIKTDIKSQKSYLLYGSLILWGLVPVTNFVLPNLFGFTFFARLSSLYVLLFCLLISYGIVKHKLFNLKAIVARASAYALTVVLFLAFYYSLVVIINYVFFNTSSSSFSQQLVFAGIAVLSAPLLVLLKRSFDRVTNKLFYRDAYDAQELIDRLNKTLVTNVEIEELLTKSALIMQEELKASFCTFYIRETSYFEARLLGAHRKQPDFENIEDIQTYASRLKTKVINIENSESDENSQKLTELLRQNEVEIMARLTNTLDYEVKGIGYIFMGAKKSGNQYSAQDVKIIEIIANELVIAIENVLRFEEIEQFNVTLQNKIDSATKELQQSNDKLKALDEAKDEFVSMASHQLRTPLTSIKGYLSMVLEGDAGSVSDIQKQMLGQAFFSSQRMVYLISDLLNVSRLKTGKFLIELKPMYLPDIVESEITQLEEGVKAKGLTLAFDKPKTFPILNLDEMKLRQVIMNFTDNAIYYTPKNGKITVSLKDGKDSVEFTVKDTGMGVPKDEQHKLFAKFYRAENARKARPDGTGLGLFMAKKVIVAQGGSIIFDSTEGKGSTFGFSFPKKNTEVKTEDLPASELKESEPKKIQESTETKPD